MRRCIWHCKLEGLSGQKTRSSRILAENLTWRTTSSPSVLKEKKLQAAQSSNSFSLRPHWKIYSVWQLRTLWSSPARAPQSRALLPTKVGPGVAFDCPCRFCRSCFRSSCHHRVRVFAVWLNLYARKDS